MRSTHPAVSRRVAIAGLCVLLLAITPARAEEQSLASQIAAIRRGFPGEMAVYMKNLSSGEELALDADRTYEMYSVIKISIMAEVLRRVERGEFTLADRMEMKADDRRLGSGILSKFDPGLRPTLKDLLTLMISVSDNTATDMLADRVGRANVTKFMRELGLKHTSIEYSVLDDYRAWFAYMDPARRVRTADEVFRFPTEEYTEEQKAEASRKLDDDPRVYFGHSTAREIGWLLEQIAKGTLVSKDASALMLEILKKQRINDRFPRYLPHLTIAHKTGDDQPVIANDAGVIWVSETPVVLVVFTAHHRGTTEALHDAIARVAAYTVLHFGGDVSPDFHP